MIDYFALALGHCLLVLAFMRLVMRDSLDIDPAITELKEAADAKRSVGMGNRRRQRGSSAPEKGSAAQ